MKRTAIILRGPPVAGKSTIARELREKIGNAVLFDVDYFILMFGGRPHIQEDKYFAYDNCVLLIKQFINNNYNIIIEELFLSQKDLDYFIKTFKKLNYKLKIFTLTAPLEILAEREKERPKHKRIGKKRIEFLYQKYKQPENSKKIYIDTSKYSVKQIVNKIYKISMK